MADFGHGRSRPQSCCPAPVVQSGLPGADVEIVYLKGGYLQHARVIGTTATVTQVAAVVSNTNLTAIALP